MVKGEGWVVAAAYGLERQVRLTSCFLVARTHSHTNPIASADGSRHQGQQRERLEGIAG
jgi:hypothetical protein